ncbi:MAG: ACT domain-containing protein [Betaproteobacteria bacterium]
MPDSLVVTVIGPDRPGLVSEIAECGKAHGASWEESRMASLAGHFAGIVKFVVPDEHSAALTSALRKLETLGLQVVVATGSGATTVAASGGRALKLDLVGQDRPGIVRDIARALADLGVSIHELETELSSAAMSGEHLFNANAILFVPPDVRTAELRRVLEALANELMVDIALDESRAG